MQNPLSAILLDMDNGVDDFGYKLWDMDIWKITDVILNEKCFYKDIL